MEFTGLDETQAGIKLAGANGNIQEALDNFLNQNRSSPPKGDRQKQVQG